MRGAGCHRPSANNGNEFEQAELTHEKVDRDLFISGELPEKFAAIPQVGFSGVEIFENDFLAFDGTPADVGRMVRDHGLEITLFQPFRHFEATPEPHRSRLFDRAERKFDIMPQLGTDSGLLEYFADRAGRHRPRRGGGAKCGLKVGYEALAWGRYIFRSPRRLGGRAAHGPSEYRADPEQLPHPVAADRHGPALLEPPFPHMPGEGDLPVEAFIRAIAETGYDGYFSLEILNDQFRGGSAESIAADGHRSLITLAENSTNATPFTGLRTGIGGTGSADAAHPVAQRSGCGRSGGHPAHARLQEDRKTAQHRSKKVSVSFQGSIRQLLNTQEHGFARASYTIRGTSAYAMAMTVDDAHDALDRAAALGAEIFSQPVDAGSAPSRPFATWAEG
ncbi:sugar phosphate isomerase/epimerase and 4-hydroxyphenylpyruvate domain-containing protein (plasmid) [Sinorhizobium meliloti]|nr:sugar phosphate isomerase/epimerase [Sinorhizobium meliloti]